MPGKIRLIACLASLALILVPYGAHGGPSLKDQMRFGVEAAEQGLWREALFRWEKYLEARPDDPRVRNNLAVAYESLGDFEGARHQYEEALRLDPDRKEIRENYDDFRQLLDLLAARSSSPGETPGEIDE